MGRNIQSGSFFELDELYTLIEETFDTCSSSREELYWLIAVLKIMLNNPNKYTQCTADNAQINYWIYMLMPIFETWKKKWHHSTIQYENRRNCPVWELKNAN